MKDGYPPYSFQGSWTLDERNTLIAILKPYTPEIVDSYFNYWIFYKDVYGERARYTGTRRTWDSGWYHTTTFDELAAKVQAFYAERHNR